MKYLFLLLAIFFPIEAQARVLFNDPTGKAFSAAIGHLSEEDVKDLSTSNSSEKKLFLGIFYIRGAPEFNIEKNCQKAVSFLQDAWENDISDAGYTLATMYYNEICVEKDLEKSRNLANKSADDGYILAQRMLGMAYIGKKWQELYPHNIKKGMYWLSKAGKAGDRTSAGQLSYIYDKGEQVPQDEKKSFYWLKKGVFNKFEKGNRIGFPVLAESYEKGVGTKINLIKAYKYYDLIGTAGVDAKKRIAKKMTQDQIDKAIQASQAWQKENNIEIGGSFMR